jgi:hypothetical protein
MGPGRDVVISVFTEHVYYLVGINRYLQGEDMSFYNDTCKKLELGEIDENEVKSFFEELSQLLEKGDIHAVRSLDNNQDDIMFDSVTVDGVRGLSKFLKYFSNDIPREANRMSRDIAKVAGADWMDLELFQQGAEARLKLSKWVDAPTSWIVDARHKVDINPAFNWVDVTLAETQARGQTYNRYGSLHLRAFRDSTDSNNVHVSLIVHDSAVDQVAESRPVLRDGTSMCPNPPAIWTELTHANLESLSVALHQALQQRDFHLRFEAGLGLDPNVPTEIIGGYDVLQEKVKITVISGDNSYPFWFATESATKIIELCELLYTKRSGFYDFVTDMVKAPLLFDPCRTTSEHRLFGVLEKYQQHVEDWNRHHSN